MDFRQCRGWHPLSLCCSEVNCELFSKQLIHPDARESRKLSLVLGIAVLNTVRNKCFRFKAKEQNGYWAGNQHCLLPPCRLLLHSAHGGCSESPLAAPSHAEGSPWQCPRGPVCSALCLPLCCSPSNLAAYRSALTRAATPAPACSVCEHYKHFQFRSLFLCLGHLPRMSA